ncbi:PREDICTED: uncharacterized protein LOC109236014 [Nicotiana attenuata]|uniref:uncharacterized protein LOC109236014 n=1 Tax=Nicotiana attenuata TaxID=49451 RepID=UPI00090501D0|nr:PREDICTED: uncharacterized protein LOC109236014 [Nicotiana attenuata]
MVTSWILNSLSKDITDSVEYVNDSVELWKELEDRYDQTNGAKLYQIQKEINDLSRGVFDIIGYYTKMKKIWEELNTLSVKTHCSCAFALLIHEEKQREFKPRNQLNIDSTALNVILGGRNFKTNYSAGTGNEITNSRPRPFCGYCKGQDHTKDKCYKLHGYPQGFIQGPQQCKQISQGYNNNISSTKERMPWLIKSQMWKEEKN